MERVDAADALKPGFSIRCVRLGCGSGNPVLRRHRQLVRVSRLALVAMVAALGCARAPGAEISQNAEPSWLVTRFPVDARFGWPGDPPRAKTATRPFSLPYGPGGEILLMRGARVERSLSGGFYSAADPALSFDGRRVLFAAQRRANDRWNIYEIGIDGDGLRQITRNAGNCRQPAYQSTLYTIVSTEPWYQLTFVSDAGGRRNESIDLVSVHLFSCRMDGSQLHRLTYNLSDDGDPFLMGDGRLLYSAWQRHSLDHGVAGRTLIMGIGIDGADGTLFASAAGRRWKRWPVITRDARVVFVETDSIQPGGGGRLSQVSFRRPLKTYQPLTTAVDGQYAWPAPWNDDQLIVSRQTTSDAPWSVWIYQPDAEPRQVRLAGMEGFHLLQAREVRPRREPDGRSSVVNASDPFGRLYCLDLGIADIPPAADWNRSLVKRVRVVEGVMPPSTASAGTKGEISRSATLAGRRVLGEFDLEADGSLNVQIPANIPVQLQALDEQGIAIRSCGWIWVRNRERRGCIGCHEDGERVPENVLVDAVKRPSLALTLARDQRRVVDFKHDVWPLLERGCLSCHGTDGEQPKLATEPNPAAPGDGLRFAYQQLVRGRATPDDDRGAAIHPGRARTSPLVWHLVGKNTSRPWDGPAQKSTVAAMPATADVHWTEAQRRLLIQWIDMGALYDATEILHDSK